MANAFRKPLGEVHIAFCMPDVQHVASKLVARINQAQDIHRTRVGITRSQTRYHVGSRTPHGHHKKKKKKKARQHNGRAKPSLVGHRPEVSGLPPGQRREGDCSLAQIEVAMMGVGPSGDVVKGACGGLRLLRVVRAFSHQQRVNPAGCRHAKRGLADADRAPLPPKKTIFGLAPVYA